jgi:hypothetical protein
VDATTRRRESSMRKRPGSVRTACGLVAVFVSSIAATTGMCQTAGPDPQSLVGLWQGTWEQPNDRQVGGQYYLTITKIEGSSVYTLFEILGRTPFKGERVGVLAGDTITFQTQYNRAVFTVDGDGMRGSVRSMTTGFPVQEISLMRKK